MAVFRPFKNEPDAPLEVVVGNSFGVDSERRVVGVGMVGGGAGGVSFLCVTVGDLCVVLGGSDSVILGGEYLWLLLEVADFFEGGGAGGVFLLGGGLDCCCRGGVAGCCCCGG